MKTKFKLGDMGIFALMLGVLVCHQWITEVKGQATEDDYINLYNTLMTNYSKHVRPIANQSAPMVIDFNFILFNIEEIDDVKQTIEISLIVNLEWQDKNLIWSPADYGGLSKLHFTSDKIWVPDVQAETTFLTQFPYKTLITPDGKVSFSVSGALKTTCQLVMTRYPYDTHTCSFTFSLIRATSSAEVFQIRSSTSSALIYDGIVNVEWSVDNLWVELLNIGFPGTEFSAAKVNIEIHRQPEYFVVTVAIPMMTLSILSLASFLIPIETGERLSYALTTLLSLSVYGTTVSAQMPRSSKPVPMILYYLTGVLINGALCVFITLIIAGIYWAKVKRVTEHSKTLIIFGIPFTISKKKAQKGSNPRNIQVHPIESKPNEHDMEQKMSGVNKINWLRGQDNKGGSIANNSQSYHEGKDVEGFSKTNGKHFIEPEVFVSDGVENWGRCKTAQTEIGTSEKSEDTTNDLDPDALRIAHLMNWASFCVLTVLFIGLTMYVFIMMNA